VNHRTWFIAGDGCFMEGISHEAASLAGHLKLGKLIGIYDDNRVSLDAMTAKSYSDDVPMRFQAYGWRVLHIRDPNTDLDEIDRVMAEAMQSDGRPTLIIAPTHIGYGSPHKQDSPKSHGNPLGEEEVTLVKEFYGWPTEPTFLVPPEVDLWKGELVERGKALEHEWQSSFDAYAAEYPAEAQEFNRVLAGNLPDGWEASLPTFTTDDKAEATRAWGGEVINAFAPSVPEFVQGAADLSGSTKTAIKDAGDVSAEDFSGRNIYFGVREHGMGAIANGMTAHGGLRVACSTFLQFYDYMKNTVRLAALMQLGTIFVYTHDSIGLGEDGPTHQQVENLAALRAVPNLVTFRPADGNEVAGAWRVALERTDGPTALVLSRQGMPNVGGSGDVSRGAYVVADGDDAVLLGTGSEVQVALGARDLLASEGVNARVVSIPSFELFRAQDQAYRNSVLPPDIIARVSVEAATSFGWHEWVGDGGAIVGVDRFGESAPAADVMQDLGITAERVADVTRGVLG
jgi:transketolase